MPSAVGGFKIVEVGSGAIVKIGDSIFQSPTSTAATYSGSGSFNTGDVPRTLNAVSATNTNDADVVDNSVSKKGTA